MCGALGCVDGQPLYRVVHPDKGARVVCGAHADALVDATPTFKSSDCDTSGSTDSRSCRSAAGNETGNEAPSPCHQSMTASDTTPLEGESADGASSGDYVTATDGGIAVEGVANDLLAGEFTRLHEKASDRLWQAIILAERGAWAEEDVEQLRELGEEIVAAADVAGRLVPSDATDKSEPADGGATGE